MVAADLAQYGPPPASPAANAQETIPATIRQDQQPPLPDAATAGAPTYPLATPPARQSGGTWTAIRGQVIRRPLFAGLIALLLAAAAGAGLMAGAAMR